MNNIEFLTLLITNANKTHNIRVWPQPWGSGCEHISKDKISQLIEWMQFKIEQGYFCNRRNESLLIYSFEPLSYSSEPTYYEFHLLIKPLNKIHETTDNTGRTLQLLINSKTGEVINTTKAMLELDLINHDEIVTNNLKPAKSYGSYHASLAPYSLTSSFFAKPIIPLTINISNNRKSPFALKH